MLDHALSSVAAANPMVVVGAVFGGYTAWRIVSRLLQLLLGLVVLALIVIVAFLPQPRHVLFSLPHASNLRSCITSLATGRGFVNSQVYATIGACHAAPRHPASVFGPGARRQATTTSKHPRAKRHAS